MKRLSLLERFTVGAVDWSWGLYTGYSTPFLEDIAASYGVGNMFKLLGMMGKSTELLAGAYDMVTAQMILGLAGTWNGCRFCGAGHLLAGNLLYFKEHGKLLPIDEHMVLEFENLTFEELAERVNGLLVDGDESFANLSRAAKRFTEIELGAKPGDSAEDKAIVAAIGTWNWLNECSVRETYDLDVHAMPALATVQKDKKLKARYRAARDAAK